MEPPARSSTLRPTTARRVVTLSEAEVARMMGLSASDAAPASASVSADGRAARAWGGEQKEATGAAAAAGVGSTAAEAAAAAVTAAVPREPVLRAVRRASVTLDPDAVSRMQTRSRSLSGNGFRLSAPDLSEDDRCSVSALASPVSGVVQSAASAHTSSASYAHIPASESPPPTSRPHHHHACLCRCSASQ